MRIWIPCLAPLLFVFVAGCGEGHSLEATATPLPSPLTEMAAGRGREVKVRVEDYKFVPSQILARPGEKLHLVIQNMGHGEHSMTFDMPVGAVSLPSHLRGGENLEYDVQVPKEPGKFWFHCPVGDHYSRGMVGYIVSQ